MKPKLKDEYESNFKQSITESLVEGTFEDLAIEFMRFKKLPRIFFTWYALTRKNKE